MCGILGQIRFVDRGPARGEEIPLRLIALMARRGPDDEGFWNDGHYSTLAFRRLSIMDLSDSAHQPMLTRDGRYAIVYNGEVYNFRDLRRELECEGARFRSTGDTEVVLYALVHWGDQALARFNGMFALGFYDSAAKKLLLARDHAGIKPLYYTLTPRGAAFGSYQEKGKNMRWQKNRRLSQ